MWLTLHQEFDYLDDFQKSLEEFELENHTQFSIHTCRTVSQAYKLKKTLPITRISSVTAGCNLYANIMVLIEVKFVALVSTKAGCLAEIVLTASVVKLNLHVCKLNIQDNHEVSKALKQTYPESQRLPAPLREEAVKLLNFGVKVGNLQAILAKFQ